MKRGGPKAFLFFISFLQISGFKFHVSGGSAFSFLTLDAFISAPLVLRRLSNIQHLKFKISHLSVSFIGASCVTAGFSPPLRIKWLYWKNTAIA